MHRDHYNSNSHYRTMLSRLMPQRYNIAAGLLKPFSARGLFSRTECSAEHDISIDTSALSRPEAHNQGKLPGKEPETEMAKHIKSIIRVRHTCLVFLVTLPR